ncbi:hypothetical protein [Streptomyces sp. DSM 40907]|uniref:hypothetical protein n=1 Tax=Streptomyces kutzneri TaxID=3051179 RepID=UPI0028D2D729|nr:hypothetical protein [Streptomyces sp. DSM 40907]
MASGSCGRRQLQAAAPAGPGAGGSTITAVRPGFTFAAPPLRRFLPVMRCARRSGPVTGDVPPSRFGTGS